MDINIHLINISLKQITYVQTVMQRRGESGTVQKPWESKAYLHCCVLSAPLSVIQAKAGNCLKWAKISLRRPNLWFAFNSCSSSGLWRLFHMQTPSAAAPQPHLLIPQPSHSLSTPFAPTIPLSPHHPTLNRLLRNLFKYFDISPPLTSRAEMICDSWRWAQSEELPPTPRLLFPLHPSL